MNFREKRQARLQTIALKKDSRKQMARRSFDSGNFNRITEDFDIAQNSINADIFNSLSAIRGRSRNSHQNNGYYIKYINSFKKGVVGAQGFTLASKAKNEKGDKDKNAVYQIEKWWKELSKSKNFSVSKNISLHAFCLIIVGQKKIDGECFIRLRRGFNNDFDFAVEIIEGYYLDERYVVENLENGNYIHCGIEFNKNGERVFYHFSEKPKTESFFSNSQPYGKKIKIPADEIIHYFDKKFYNQIRGYPDGQHVLFPIHTIEKTDRAEVIKKRFASENMGFLIPKEGEEYEGVKASDGSKEMQVEAGTFKELRAGTEVKGFNIEDKGDGNAAFTKKVLQGVSSSLELSYPSFSNNYEGIQPHTLRDMIISERDTFKLEQRVLIDEVLSVIFEEALKLSLLSQKLKLPFSKIDRWLEHEFMSRAYEPINLLEEAQANDIKFKNASKSRTQDNREKNIDQEDVFAELKEETKLSSEYGVPLYNLGGTLDHNLGEIKS